MSEVNVNVERTGQSARPFVFTAPAEVWHDVLMWMNENADAGVRRSVTKDLSAECDIDRLEDNSDEVTIRPTKKAVSEVTGALSFLGLEVDLDSLPEPEKPERTARTRATKEPTYCHFSGEPTSGGNFRPGFDMKLKGALVRIIDDASLSDTDTVTVGTGTAATEYTVAGAMEKLLSYPWHYTEEGLNERRAKALSAVQEKADRRAQREAEAAERKAAKAAAKETAAEAEAA